MTLQPFADVTELRAALDGIASVADDDVEITDAAGFRGDLIDRLIRPPSSATRGPRPPPAG